jgi:ClpP class serine protease
MKNLKPLSIKQSFGLLFFALICAGIGYGGIKLLEKDAECTGICSQSITEQYNAIGHNKFELVNTTSFTINGQKIDLTKRAFVVKYHGPVTFQASELFQLKLLALSAKVGKGDLVILNVESPGGVASACTSDHKYVQDFKATTKATVISTTDTLAASCGYYIASAADSVYSSQGAMMGNIGSVMKYGANPVETIVKRLGGSTHCIGSTPIKEMFAGCGINTKEQRDAMKAFIDNSAQEFFDDVSAARNGKIKDEELAFSAMPFSGRQALALGLTDKIIDSKTFYRDLVWFGFDIQEIVIK